MPLEFKTFHDEYAVITEEGRKFREKLFKAGMPIIQKYLDEGYHPFEVLHIVKMTFDVDVYEHLARVRFKKRQEEGEFGDENQMRMRRETGNPEGEEEET